MSETACMMLKRTSKVLLVVVFVNRNMRRSLKLEVVTQTRGRTLAVATLCLACTKKLKKWHRKVRDGTCCTCVNCVAKYCLLHSMAGGAPVSLTMSGSFVVFTAVCMIFQ